MLYFVNGGNVDAVPTNIIQHKLNILFEKKYILIMVSSKETQNRNKALIVCRVDGIACKLCSANRKKWDHFGTTKNVLELNKL